MSQELAGLFERQRGVRQAHPDFVADSHTVAAQLRHLPDTIIDRHALVVLNMIATIDAFLGGTDRAMHWLISRAAPTGPASDRTILDQVTAAVLHGRAPVLPSWYPAIAPSWRARAAALTTYRNTVPKQADTDAICESLLHMHHNRLLGIDRGSEVSCRRLARHAALAWTMRARGNQ